MNRALRQCLFCLVVSGLLAGVTLIPWGALEVFEFKTVDVRMWLRERLRAPAPRTQVHTLLLDDASLARHMDAAGAVREALLQRLKPRGERAAPVVGVELPTWHSVATPLLEDVLAAWWAQPAPPAGRDRLVVGLKYGAQAYGRESRLPPLTPPGTGGIRVGTLEYDGDHDGVVRSVPLVTQVDDQLVPSFLLQLVCAYDDVDVTDVRVQLGRSVQLRRGDALVRRIPIDARGGLIVNYRERPATSRTSVVALLDPAVQLPNVPVLLLGTSARWVSQQHRMPVGGRGADVTLTAEGLETILSSNFIWRVGRLTQFAFVWLVLFVGSLGMVRLPSWRSVALGSGVVLGYFVLEKLLFIWFDVWLDFVLPIIALSWGAMVFPVYGFRSRTKRLVGEMRALRRLDDLVLMNIAGGLVVANRHGVVVRHNPRASELLGIPRESLHGRHVRELFAVSPATLEVFSQVMGAHPATEMTLPISKRVSMTSDEYPVERVFELGVALVDPELLKSTTQDDRPCYVLTFDDVTDEVQQAQEEARRARLAALGEIAAKLGHELRNSLGGLRIFVEHVRDEIPPTGVGVRSIDSAIREIESLYRKIDELRQYGRDPQLELTRCDLKDLLEEALAFANQKLSDKNMRVLLECEKDLPALHVDRRQLREAFQNLINNAIEAAPQGGRIVIRAERHASNNGSGPRSYQVQIEDNGPGISAATREHIFSLFFTTKPDIGTGLGLPIVKKIVESHGGRVTFDCNDGGTVFTVILPAPPGMQEVER